MHWMHWKGTSRGCTRKRKERQGVGWITAYPAPGPSRWKEGAMGCQASNRFCKGIPADEDPSRLLLSLFSHEYFFAVFPDMKEKKKAVLRIPSQAKRSSEQHRAGCASALPLKTLRALTEKLDARPLWADAKSAPGIACFALPSLRALFQGKRVRLTQCHCFGDCYFSHPKSQIISMAMLLGSQACNKILINYLSTARLLCLIGWQTKQEAGKLPKGADGAIHTQWDSNDPNLRCSVPLHICWWPYMDGSKDKTLSNRQQLHA